MTDSRHKKSARQGFIAMVSLILLVIFAILGVAYWLSSRLTTDMIFAESQRIKARNFAQAALEKVKINITNQYLMNNHDLEYPPRYTNDRVTKEYNIQFADGEFKVISVKPYEQGGRRFYNVAHHSKGVKIGNYDIWEVTTNGVAKSTGITAELRALVKIYRDYVVY
ncbi:MAG TPA: hypothetical protein DCG57_18570 [Candidatus Riflebacteria bacterium]|jgi:hypothetical protein|nr:MAG: hypothetical protein CVV41_18755 [Candidatus Riflebacteria bacterium HGW-Riflebacteria-1]HAE40614.1 hypothetical protein [Candidatus Riflebacteria bacterium]